MNVNYRDIVIDDALYLCGWLLRPCRLGKEKYDGRQCSHGAKTSGLTRLRLCGKYGLVAVAYVQKQTSLRDAVPYFPETHFNDFSLPRCYLARTSRRT